MQGFYLTLLEKITVETILKCFVQMLSLIN